MVLPETLVMEPDPHYIDPLKPEPIPTTPPDAGTLPYPAPTMPGWESKPLVKSKTIITIAGTILFFVLGKFFGIEIEWQHIVGDDGILTAYEAILLLGAIVAAWFRKVATGPINGVINTPPEG